MPSYREKPDILVNWNFCTTFVSADFQRIDLFFDIAVEDYGVDNSFSWTSGGEEFAYTITKLDSFKSWGDKTPRTAWQFEHTDLAVPNKTYKVFIDCGNEEVLDEDKSSLKDEAKMNDIAIATIDLFYEDQARYPLDVATEGEEVVPRARIFMERENWKLDKAFGPPPVDKD